ncbi:zinc finger protein DPF3-like [Sycon ciliatum]|uniref:zinc finger protein DPF3-like n=1 Tax=Sycon ciliatum TaxID=27933 RepID=UPI0031F695DD
MSSLYQDAVEYVAAYNSTLAVERRRRPEHWDVYTHIWQRPCHLWRRRSDRQHCRDAGRVYAYAARRWKVNKGWTAQAVKEPPAPAAEPTKKCTNPYQTRSAERPRTVYVEENTSDESDDMMDDAGDSDADVNEESSDGEIHRATSRQSSRRAPSAASTRSSANASTDEKPLNCNMCGKICKTMNGLLLHLNANPSHYKVHPDLKAPSNDRASSPGPATPSVQGTSGGGAGGGGSGASEEPAPAEVSQTPKVKANDYCDFCLGTATENAKTKKPELLVSCADCGRSGHPTCLQFTADIMANVVQYSWQCIECKSCGVCGSSDNDDQLLFCDDCDRGFHMFCLKPPISEPPEGKWSCTVCTKPSASTTRGVGRPRKRGRRKRR